MASIVALVVKQSVCGVFWGIFNGIIPCIVAFFDVIIEYGEVRLNVSGEGDVRKGSPFLVSVVSKLHVWKPGSYTEWDGVSFDINSLHPPWNFNGFVIDICTVKFHLAS